MKAHTQGFRNRREWQLSLAWLQPHGARRRVGIGEVALSSTCGREEGWKIIRSAGRRSLMHAQPGGLIPGRASGVKSRPPAALPCAAPTPLPVTPKGPSGVLALGSVVDAPLMSATSLKAGSRSLRCCYAPRKALRRGSTRTSSDRPTKT